MIKTRLENYVEIQDLAHSLPRRSRSEPQGHALSIVLSLDYTQIPRESKDDQEWYYRALVEVFTSRVGENEAAASLFQRFALEVKILFG